MMHSQFHLHTLTDFSPESMETSRSNNGKSGGKRSTKLISANQWNIYISSKFNWALTFQSDYNVRHIQETEWIDSRREKKHTLNDVCGVILPSTHSFLWHQFSKKNIGKITKSENLRLAFFIAREWEKDRRWKIKHQNEKDKLPWIMKFIVPPQSEQFIKIWSSITCQRTFFFFGFIFETEFIQI